MKTELQSRGPGRAALLSALLVLGGAWVLGLLLAPGEGVAQAVPASREELLARGERFYTQSCGHCHGDTGDGTGEDGGADLRDLRDSNARIAVVIRRGIPGEMPGFRKKYGPEEIAALTEYLRTFRK